jgi:hypothetical protein
MAMPHKMHIHAGMNDHMQKHASLWSTRLPSHWLRDGHGNSMHVSVRVHVYAWVCEQMKLCSFSLMWKSSYAYSICSLRLMFGLSRRAHCGSAWAQMRDFLMGLPNVAF